MQELDALTEDVDDLAAYLDDHPDVVRRLMANIEVIDVNENALDYYGAPSKEVLIDNLEQVFTDDAFETMRDMWVALAAGERNFRWETVGQTLGATANTNSSKSTSPTSTATTSRGSTSRRWTSPTGKNRSANSRNGRRGSRSSRASSPTTSGIR